MNTFRNTFTTTLAAAALAAVPAATAQADVALGTPQANAATMQASIQSQLAASGVFGWQFAIAQNGQLVRTSAGLPAGTAVSAADTGGSSIAMAPTMRMEIMSATKTFTAVATLKLLRANDLTIESFVAPYLPSEWARGDGFKLFGEAAQDRVRFRHLLSHTSGISQMLTGLGDAAPDDNGWDAMRTVVANDVQPDAVRVYKNANYALLRILNAVLWKRSGGELRGPAPGYLQSHGSDGTGLSNNQPETTVLSVDEGSAAAYALDHMRKKIFEPIGIPDVACFQSSNSLNAMRGYRPNANQTTTGNLLVTAADECAGHRGLRLSSIEMVRFLAHLRHGTLVHPDDRALMDQQLLGWSESSNGGVFWHGGDVRTPGNWSQVHTCNTTFPDGTEAAIIVNSQFASGTAAQCGILRNAWQVAR